MYVCVCVSARRGFLVTMRHASRRPKLRRKVPKRPGRRLGEENERKPMKVLFLQIRFLFRLWNCCIRRLFGTLGIIVNMALEILHAPFLVCYGSILVLRLDEMGCNMAAAPTKCPSGIASGYHGRGPGKSRLLVRLGFGRCVQRRVRKI